MTAKELGDAYQGFYTDSRTRRTTDRKPIDKANPNQTVYLKNATKAGEKDKIRNKNEYNEKKLADENEEF